VRVAFVYNGCMDEPGDRTEKEGQQVPSEEFERFQEMARKLLSLPKEDVKAVLAEDAAVREATKPKTKKRTRRQ
jgi:hypothetical protein